MLLNTGSNNSGYLLVDMVVGVTVAGAISAAMVVPMVVSGKLLKHAETYSSLRELQSRISAQIDCNATFQMNKIDMEDALACPEVDAGEAPLLTLYGRTMAGVAVPLFREKSVSLDKMGLWTLKTRCSAKSRTLVIQAAQIDNTGNPVNAPMVGGVLDFSNSKMNLFGPDKPLCYGSNMSSGNMIMGTRVFKWDGATRKPTADSGKIYSSADTSNFVPLDDFGKYPTNAGTYLPGGLAGDDGIGCNVALGWKPITCNQSISPPITASLIQDIKDGGRFFWDNDIGILIGSHGTPGTANEYGAGCVTNDWDQLTFSGSVNVNTTIAMDVVCWKIE